VPSTKSRHETVSTSLGAVIVTAGGGVGIGVGVGVGDNTGGYTRLNRKGFVIMQ